MNKGVQYGFSLIEMLVAVALSAWIMTGLITLYLGIKTNDIRQQALTDLQDTGRFIDGLLNQRIRTAGFAGCVDSSEPVIQDQAITGYSGEHLPAELQNQVVGGTDVVVIKSCVSHSQLSQNAQRMELAYYIGDTHRKNQQGSPILGLFQKPLDNGEREELAAGVEQMRILYGESPNVGNLLIYKPATEVTDWKQVRGVQIDLLLNSIDEVLKKSQTFYFQGRAVIATDRLLHKPWSTYVALRERIGHV